METPALQAALQDAKERGLWASIHLYSGEFVVRVEEFVVVSVHTVRIRGQLRDPGFILDTLPPPTYDELQDGERMRRRIAHLSRTDRPVTLALDTPQVVSIVLYEPNEPPSQTPASS